MSVLSARKAPAKALAKAPARAPRAALIPPPVKKAARVPAASAPVRRRLGRPKMDREDLGTLQTRVPQGLKEYLEFLTKAKLSDQPDRFVTMQRMLELTFTRFLSEKPWEMGLLWRESKAIGRMSGGELAEKTDWKQMNILLPESLARAAREEALRQERSVASFCYTALYWWCRMIYPPAAN